MISYQEQKGRFVKHCPCTPDVVPCGYYNINLHAGCPFQCSYCILQTYLKSPAPVFFTNMDQLEAELAEAVREVPHLRIGTGELSDSLAFDPVVRYSHKILAIMEKFPQAVFEFKTKSVQVEHLLSYKPKPDNIVIGWSLNPEEVIAREELLTPPLPERLAAMKAVIAAGYKVAIHFDPMLLFSGWKEAYLQLIRAIAREIPVPSVAWWSLGALRFPVSLREHIFRHPRSRLFDGELIRGHDGKYRYVKTLRLELFLWAASLIRKYFSGAAPLYLCMEDEEVWQEALPGITPDEQSVNRYLWEHARLKP